MDISSWMPDQTEKRISNIDPFGEESWKIDKPELYSSAIIIFKDNSRYAKRILSFSWITNGKKCTNTLYIDNSEFHNIDINMLKQLIDN